MRGVNSVWRLYRSAEALRHPKPDFQQTSLNTTIPIALSKAQDVGHPRVSVLDNFGTEEKLVGRQQSPNG
jgi:hypothetical protein